MVNFDSPKNWCRLFIRNLEFIQALSICFFSHPQKMFLMYKLLILKISVVGSQPKPRENHTIYNNAVNDKYTCVK